MCKFINKKSIATQYKLICHKKMNCRTMYKKAFFKSKPQPNKCVRKTLFVL